jgi:ganglioside-induced differentiation-associated protein 1
VQHGINAPGAADKIRLYDGYLQKVEEALADSPWLVGSTFSMADIAMPPYVNRLSTLSMEGLWSNGRLPRVENWFERVKERPTFKPAFIDWMPSDLSEEMRSNGDKSWPQIKARQGLRAVGNSEKPAFVARDLIVGLTTGA